MRTVIHAARPLPVLEKLDYWRSARITREPDVPGQMRSGHCGYSGHTSQTDAFRAAARALHLANPCFRDVEKLAGLLTREEFRLHWSGGDAVRDRGTTFGVLRSETTREGEVFALTHYMRTAPNRTPCHEVYSLCF